jgi:hypothetical protein
MGTGMAMAPDDPPQVLEAGRFDVLDENGNVMASLCVNDGAPELVFLDKTGQVITIMRASSDGALLSLRTGDDSAATELAVKRDVAEVRLKSSDGAEMRWVVSDSKTEWSMSDQKKVQRIVLGVAGETASFRINDEDGRVRLALGVDENGQSSFKLLDETGDVRHELK